MPPSSAQPKPPYKALPGKILVGLLGTVFALFLVEGCLQLTTSKPELQSGWRLHNKTVVLDDDVIVIVPKFTYDEFYQRTEAHHLIVALGDSFTEGYPVAGCHDPRVPCNKDDTWPGALAKELREKGISAQVVNAGFSDSGPDQHLRLFETRILPRLKPDIVIWQFCGNDLYDNFFYPVYSITESGVLSPLSGRDNWLWKRRRFSNNLPLPMIVADNSRVIQHILHTFQLGWMLQVPPAYKKDAHQWSIEKLEIELETMNRLANEHDFEAYFVLITPQSQYLRETNPERWDEYVNTADFKTLRRILSKQSRFELAYFEQPELVAAGIIPTAPGAPGVAEMIFANDRDQLEEGMRHFNEEGYRLLAKRVGERLVRDQVVR